MRYFPEILACK
jgi:hypothetical protein